MLLKLAWRNIWRNKRRSLITIASILFAVFFAVIARSFQLGMYGKMISGTVENSSGYLQIHKKGYWDDQNLDNSLEEIAIEKFSSIEEIKQVTPRLEGFALSAHGDMTKAVKVSGTDPTNEDLMLNLPDKIIAGTYFNDSSKKAIITEGLASFYKLSVGDTLYLLGQGYHATNATGRYIIGGIAKFAHPLLNQGTVYLPLKEAQWFFNAPGLVTAYIIDLENPSSLEGVQARLISKFDTTEVEIMNWKEMLPELIQAIEMDSAGGIIMIFILYMVVVFGVFGTILMMTAERKTEFGVMVAIGMKRWKLSLITTLEVLLLGLLGVIFGIFAASPIAFYFSKNPIALTGKAAEAIKEYGLEPVIPTSTDFSISLTHGSLIMAITIMLSFYPVIYILRLKVINAMRG